MMWIGYDFNLFGLGGERRVTVLKNNKMKLEEVNNFSKIKTYYNNGLKGKFKKFTNKQAVKN